MIQNFRLLELRTQIPITQIQFIPKFLLPHEINAIQDITKTFEFQDAKVLEILNVRILFLDDPALRL